MTRLRLPCGHHHRPLHLQPLRYLAPRGLAIRPDLITPRILVTAEIVEGLRDGMWETSISLSENDVLRIEVDDWRLVYRLGAYDLPLDAYCAEWPD